MKDLPDELRDAFSEFKDWLKRFVGDDDGH